MTNNILVDDTKRLDLGFITVCDAVSRTLGAEGKLAVLENLQREMPPDITKDGVSVAERIRFKDTVINFGALQAISAAAQTLQKSGDSTTSCLVFARGFMQGISRDRFNKSVERGIELGVKQATNYITKLSKPVDRKVLKMIATTSANNDSDLADIILQAYDKVGFEGIVNVKKDYKSNKTEVLSQNGMRIDKGYSSPFFINNQKKSVWEAENVMVLALETWQADDTILSFLKNNRFVKDSTSELQPILIVMEKEDLDFRMKLIELAEINQLAVCLVVAPHGENELKNISHIRDLALYTEGVAYKPESEIKSGFADKVTVDFEKTVVVRNTVPQAVTTLIEELKSAVDFDKDPTFIKQRIQRLEGISCIISVGGNSPNDVNERYDRVDDALASVKSAVPEGYIAGGGSALVYISNSMNSKLPNFDEQLGYDLVKKVLREPFKQILRNANRFEPTPMAQFFGAKGYIKNSEKHYGFGYNAKTDRVSNLVEDGILDSAKSIRVALESAKEVAIKMLLTQVIVTFP